MSPHRTALTQRTRRPKSWLMVVVAGTLAMSAPARAEISAADAKSGIVECTPAMLKEHNPGLADNPDRLICFEGYVSNFNTKPRKDRGKDKFLGGAALGRASHQALVAAAQERQTARRLVHRSRTRRSSASRRPTPATPSRSRSRTRIRTGTSAAIWRRNIWSSGSGRKRRCYTHNVVNAVPQLSQFNAQPWLTPGMHDRRLGQ